MEVSKVKERIQEEAVELSDRYDHVLLSWATGTSKTLAAIKAYERYLEVSAFNGKGINAYIILKETNHEENWRREFVKWNKEHLLSSITFFCYASLHKYENTQVSFLILDEVHALSEMREDKLDTIQCEKMISLSATVGKEVKKRLMTIKPYFEYHISLQTAIDEGLVPPPKIYVSYIELDDQIKVLVWSKKDPKLYTQKEYYKKLSKRITYWENQYMKSGEAWQERKWMQSALERKKFMAEAKTFRAKEILAYLKGKRFICFTGGIDQCTGLGGPQAIHSKFHKKHREKILEDYNNFVTNEVYAVGMLREGMNLEGIQAAVIIQLDNQQGSAEQMIGRALRSIAPEIYIILCRDTKDEDYFERATKGIDPQYMEEFILPSQV